MKTKTLLMVAGAGVLVYWLWKKNNKGGEIAKKDAPLKGDNVTKKGSEGVALKPLSQAATKEECRSLGGDWWPEVMCIAAPCPKCFPSIQAQLLNK